MFLYNILHIIITCAFYIQNLHVVWGFNINSIKSYHKYQKSKSYNRKKLEFILNEISGNGWYVVETQPLSSDINLAFHLSNAMKNEKKFIRLDTSKGWGSGSHPTTRLCLDFITENVSTGMKVLDYGTGSGVLSIYAALSGASICYGVDVDEDSLITAKSNVKLNNVEGIVKLVHTSTMYLGDENIPLFDVAIANILPGPLTRLSGLLCLLIKPGGLLCLSGMRHDQLKAVKEFYLPLVDINTETTTVSTNDENGSWVSWVVKTKVLSNKEKSMIIEQFSELAAG